MTTLVFLHAHPDDEALLTAGTMARAAAEGQRVVLVVATDGAAGLPRSGYGDLGAAALAELRRQRGRARGRPDRVARVRRLRACTATGSAPTVNRRRCAPPPVDEAAGRLADVLREESADVLVTYDANGGYGHPDHVRCHQVAVAAAELAGTPGCSRRPCRATCCCAASRLAAKLYRFPPEFDPATLRAGVHRRRRTSRTASTCAVPAGASAPRWPRTHPGHRGRR